MIRTKYIRYTRIIKHLIYYLITNNIIYKYEIQHYYYMKRFSNINYKNIF